MDIRELLIESFRTAVAAADPRHAVAAALPAPPRGRTLVVGAGKAAAAMAAAVEANWPAHLPLSGAVVTRYGHGLPLQRIRVMEAAHPVPDDRGVAGARELLRLAGTLAEDDLLLVLVSGGGSALLPLPAGDLTLAALQAVTTDLLRSGAPIQEMNTVRKHLSGILGGRLAAATRARVEVLIVSDVVGDDPASIASGPCTPDPSTFDEALAVIRRHGVNAPAEILAHLQSGIEGRIAETPKPDDPLFGRVSSRLIASSAMALDAAREFLQRQGMPAVIIGDAVTGEAREVARAHAALAAQVAGQDHPWPAPVALLSGGECTVSVKGSGRGGRCSEYLLGLAMALGEPWGRQCQARGTGIWALACDTDGIDGSEANAGALYTPSTLQRAQALGVEMGAHARNNDAWGFFNALGDLVVTGPTLTNVNDYRILVVTPANGPRQ